MNGISNHTLSQKSKKYWEALLTTEIVSSEDEKIAEGEKSFERRARKNRPLQIEIFFEDLDSLAKSTKSKRGEFRNLRRTKGEPKEEEIKFNEQQMKVLRRLDIEF